MSLSPSGDIALFTPVHLELASLRALKISLSLCKTDLVPYLHILDFYSLHPCVQDY